MNNILAYSLSLGGFLALALWWMLFKSKIKGMFGLIYSSVFITLGVLSLKYIDALPVEYISWFKYPTIVMALIGGVAILIHSQSFEGHGNGKDNN